MRNGLYLNMFQFVLAILFVIKLSKISINHIPKSGKSLIDFLVSQNALISTKAKKG